MPLRRPRWPMLNTGCTLRGGGGATRTSAGSRATRGYLVFWARPRRARLGRGARRDAPNSRLPTVGFGVALTWLASSSGAVRGVAGKGFVLARSSGALLAFVTAMSQEERRGRDHRNGPA